MAPKSKVGAGSMVEDRGAWKLKDDILPLETPEVEWFKSTLLEK